MQTRYVVHMLIEDRGYNQKRYNVTFSTLDRPLASDFTLKFRVRELTESDRKLILRNCAFILSLNNSAYLFIF